MPGASDRAGISVHVGKDPRVAAIAEADEDELVEIVSSLVEEETESSGKTLRAALSALRRRQARLAREPSGEQEGVETLERVTATVQKALAARRLAASKETARTVEQWPRVHREILQRLASRPATPKELAANVRSAKEHVTRTLAKLSKKGLVAAGRDPNDGRRRLYALTAKGEALAADLLAFGAERHQPASLPAEVVREALEQALAAVVDLRRRTGNREEALQRLNTIVEQARAAGAMPLALRGLIEVLATLRQAGRDQELDPHLEQLSRIASGADPAFPSTLAVPALAYLEYELGRCGPTDLIRRAGHLVTAGNLFGRLAQEEEQYPWRSRQAWAFIGLADNLRQQSRFGDAMDSAREARRIFTELGDPYGTVRSRFVLGFCLRLRGQFIEASEHVETAHRLAVEHGFAAFAADSLMQLGEVRRCLGDTKTAATMLAEAHERAVTLRLPLTQAFAESSLAAATHAQGADGEALERLSAANELFVRRHHGVGIALNLRRKAVVLRQAATSSRDLRSAAALLDEARTMYQGLQSPAGVVACLIEAGYIAIARQQDPSEHCKELIVRIGGSRRFMLELDPWVPRMLVEFAKVAKHDKLRAEAKRLLEHSDRVLADHEAETDAACAAEDDCTPPASPRKVRDVDPMAGEHRRMGQGAYVTAAI